MERITSAKNPLIQRMRRLRDRRERERTGRMLVEGEVMIREALSCGLTIGAVLAVDEKADFAQELSELGAKAVLVSQDLIGSVCETKSPQGVCAEFSMPEPTPVGQLPDRVVVLDGVQDPGNVGTIWRTADAAGFGAVLFGEGCADPLSPKVLRAAMGSGFRLPYARAVLTECLPEMQKDGCCVIASELHGEDFYRRPPLPKRIALVIGNEAAGVSPEVLSLADVRLKLPMRGGAESLNAAIAAAVMMYDIANR